MIVTPILENVCTFCYNDKQNNYKQYLCARAESEVERRINACL